MIKTSYEDSKISCAKDKVQQVQIVEYLNLCYESVRYYCCYQKFNVSVRSCGFSKSLTIKYLGSGTEGFYVLGETGERVLVGRVRSDRMPVIPVLLLIFTGRAVVATQPEPEQVSLSAVYNFLTDDLVARRFYVQIIAQVINTVVID